MKHLTIFFAATLLVLPSSLLARGETNSYTYQVVSVYDGDTFRINMPGLPPELSRVSVRIRGIDAPELRGKCESERRWARQSAIHLEGIIARGGGTVTLRGLRWDKYGGRIAADVFVNGQSVAREMISRGMARPYTSGRREVWCQ